MEERTRETNRLQKVLEDANVKLSTVASDMLGASSRQMLSAIIAGQDDPKRWRNWRREPYATKWLSWSKP